MTLPINLIRSRRSAGVALVIAFMVWQMAHSAHSQTPQAGGQDKPCVVEYYYKAKWGYADEFLRLFKKNHYPFLKKQIERGNVLQVTAETPVNHGTEEGRWDYRIRIVWKNILVAYDDSGDEQIFKTLFPDQETYKREEQRRFEILLAHWDLPVRSVELNEK